MFKLSDIQDRARFTHPAWSSFLDLAGRDDLGPVEDANQAWIWFRSGWDAAEAQHVDQEANE